MNTVLKNTESSNALKPMLADRFKMEEFDEFEDLYVERKPKENLVFEKRALKWFKNNFNAVFGSDCNTKEKPLWYYTCGILIFGLPNIGEYNYKFIIEILHLQLWKEEICKEGFDFGFRIRNKEEFNHNGRDSNPYEKGTYDYQKWDCGYISGLGGFSFDRFSKTVC